jgi:hypothetical protein
LDARHSSCRIEKAGRLRVDVGYLFLITSSEHCLIYVKDV